MPPEHELGVDPLLERRETQLLEPLDGRTWRTARRRSRRAAARARARAPRRAGRAAAAASSRARARPASAGQALEAGEVEVLVADSEHVTGRPGLDRVGRAERAPELRHLALNLRDRGHGRPSCVQLVGKPLDGNDPVRVQEQDRERRALPRPAELDCAVLADDLERSQEAELEHRSLTVADR